MTGIDTGSVLWEMAKVGLALGLVIVIIILLARFIPRLLRTSKYFKTDTDMFVIRQRVSLGLKKELIIVEKENIKLLLGVTEQNINLLKDLSTSPLAEQAVFKVEEDYE